MRSRIILKLSGQKAGSDRFHRKMALHFAMNRGIGLGLDQEIRQ